MPSKLPQFNVHAEKEVFEKIAYIAGANDRSTNKEIVTAIKQYIALYEKKYGEIKLYQK